MPDRPVLVTGAAGFIGSHLTDRLLAEGESVVGLDNFSDFYPEALKRRNLEAAMPHPRFELVEADIRDRGAVLDAFATHRPAAVVHLAAMAGVRPSIERPGLYAAVNLGGTVNLLDAAAGSGVERFLFASSSSVYGNNPKVPFAEGDPVDHPISPYAATKKAGELLCHAYCHLHRLPITCLRFFTVFGPRQRPDLAIGKFLRLVAEGRPVPVFGDGSTSRDYTYVGDIVGGIRAALDACGKAKAGEDAAPPATGPAEVAGKAAAAGYRLYNLGGNHPASLRDLLATIERVTGRQAAIQRLPPQPGDVERTWADLTRSRAELGYRPTTSLEVGIAHQWAWMRETR